MTSLTANPLDSLLKATVAELDIPPQMYAAADAQYKAIGQFLANHENGGRAGWDIYPQGSFRLGTVVQPIVLGDEYDIDLVCRANIAKTSTTQAELKHQVGLALQEYVRTASSPTDAPVKCSDRRRCWTLEYEAPFHLDVLPAIPDVENLPTGILLTDRGFHRWLKSDPIAYATWFRGRMAREFESLRAAKAAVLGKSIEDVPEWEVKTTLQRVVQVMKRHRDMYFAEDLDVRPASIIITTLAGRVYDGEHDLVEAVIAAAKKMTLNVKQENGKWIVGSPVADENFADKWSDEPERAARFFTWLQRLHSDFVWARDVALRGEGLDTVVGALEKSMGARPVRAAAKRYGEGLQSVSSAGMLTAAATGALNVATSANPRRTHNFFGSNAEDA